MNRFQKFQVLFFKYNFFLHITHYWFIIFQPGYYKSKEVSIITSSLIKFLLELNLFTMDITSPQKHLDYINQVLVPETAILLISQDHCISTEDAITVIEDSVDFEVYVHDIEIDDK